MIWSNVFEDSILIQSLAFKSVLDSAPTEENLLLYAEMVKKNYIRYARRVLELD